MRDLAIGIIGGSFVVGAALFYFYGDTNADPDYLALESLSSPVLKNKPAAESEPIISVTQADESPQSPASTKLTARPATSDLVSAHDAPLPDDEVVNQSMPRIGVPLPAVGSKETENDNSLVMASGMTQNVESDPGAARHEARSIPNLTDGANRADLDSGRSKDPTAKSRETSHSSEPADSGKPDTSSREAPRVPITHDVAANETLSQIAVKYYGSTRFVDVILKANSEVKSPRSLRAGQRLLIPDPERVLGSPQSSGKAVAVKGSDSPKQDSTAPEAVVKTYVVVKGDTLSSIAAAKLGNSRKWRELYSWNRDVIGSKPENMQIGMKLRLGPASAGERGD